MLYAKNSIYPIVYATKFTAHEQYHVTCATRNDLLTRTYLFTIQLLWGYDDD